MTSDTPRPQHPALLLLVAVCIIAANMRATITGVGPLLTQISADLDVAPAALGALASVPLVAWAVVSPLAHDLSRRFGLDRVVLWALIALAAGTIWRSLPGNTVNLWLGAALIGVALAIANVLMPAVIKHNFQGRVPAVMALYTALLAGVGALASGVVVPISHLVVNGGELGWRVALAATGILLPVAIAVWLWSMIRTRSAATSPRPDQRAPRTSTGIWTDPVAWQVALYMGLQSATFYMLLTWLAPLSISLGRSEVVAGIDVMLYQILGIVGSLALPFALRGRVKRWTPALVPTFAIVAALGLIVAPSAVLAWACLSGLSAGGALAMSLTLMAQRARDSSTSVALSGMSQSVGYVIAALGPIAFGALHALTGGWAVSLLLLTAVLIGQGVVGLFVGRDRHVLEPPRPSAQAGKANRRSSSAS